MIKYEDCCVGCPPEIGCLGRTCPYMNVPVYYCDSCQCDGAEYHYDCEDICEECLIKVINLEWAMKSVEEKASLLSEPNTPENELDDIFNYDLTLNEKIDLLDMYVRKAGD